MKTLLSFFTGTMGCLMLLAMIAIGPLAVHFDATFWASYFQHRAVVIPWFPCIVAGLVPPIAGPAVLIAILTWIVSFAI